MCLAAVNYQAGALGRGSPLWPPDRRAALVRARTKRNTSCATNSTMASVGIRELRQRASELVRRVENGESIEITDRGRPVAVLAPLPDDPVQRLQAAGDLQPSEGDLDDLPEPLPLPAGSEAPSRVLARLRRDER